MPQPVRRARRARVVGSFALGSVLALAGCGGDPGSEPSPGGAAVVVTGSAGAPPMLDFTAPVDLSDSRAQVVWPGRGPALEKGGPVLLNLYAQDGRDHTVLTNTYADRPRWFSLTRESLGKGMADALRDQKVGARVLYVEEDDDIPVVVVIDVLPTRATGEAVAPVEGVPTVDLGADGAPTVAIPPDTPAPIDIGIQPLIRGAGPQVEAGQTVTVRYTGVVWSTGAVFDSNWADGDGNAPEPLSTTIGVGQVIEGWDQGLLEQTVGSQVLVVVPPDLGYGGTASPLAEETLVFVVDILDAHFPAADDPSAPAADQPAEPVAPVDPQP